MEDVITPGTWNKDSVAAVVDTAPYDATAANPENWDAAAAPATEPGWVGNTAAAGWQ